MRIVFAGTPDFALPSLQMVRQRYELVGVICPPDRAVGRGRKVRPCAVKSTALAWTVPIYQPVSMTDLVPTLQALSYDVMVVVAYGQLLKSAILRIPPFGCVNVHASLLPRWRGAAPIARAIEAGDDDTGISIMQMAEGLDDGDILLQQKIAIGQDSAHQLSEKLAVLGAQALKQVLDELPRAQQQAVVQDETLACYASKLNKQQAVIHWHDRASVIVQKIRAFNPTPVCYSELFGQRVRIYEALVTDERSHNLPHSATIGEAVIDHKQLFIRCQDGWMAPLLVQAQGKKKMPIADFLNGLQAHTLRQ